MGESRYYKQGVYHSGLIHHTVLGGLAPSTQYWYQCGGAEAWSPIFNFTTPPAVRTLQSVALFGTAGAGTG